MGLNNDANGLKKHNNQNQVAVVAIPLPAQGHLNPLLELSHLLTAVYHIPVHYLCSAAHSRQARLRSNVGSDSNSGPDPLDPTNKNTKDNIHFHDLQFIPSPISSPPPHPNTKFPTSLQLILQSSYLLHSPISQLLLSFSSKYKKIIVIHDSLMASVVAQDVKSIPNAESYTFHTSSAFAIFFTIWESMVEKPFQLGPDIPMGVPSCQGWSSPDFEKFLARQYELLSLSSGRLYNTCTSLEGRYIDLLRQLPVNENKKLFAIGPINQLRTTRTSKINSKTKHRCMEWLDEQERDSVIYVSFGTTISMSEEQIRELAIGLDRSQQKFIWVLRDADKVETLEKNYGEIRGRNDKLPKGYEEKVKGRGIVIRDWAPQVEILGHPATGGFLSHCGWNSCMESLSMGVPIAAWPLHSDQPKNSFLVTEVLKVGVVVRNLACNDHDNEVLVKSSVVENAVKRLMASKEGKEIRKRAGELGASIGSSAAIGGSSWLDMDAFVAHITR